MKSLLDQKQKKEEELKAKEADLLNKTT